RAEHERARRDLADAFHGSSRYRETRRDACRIAAPAACSRSFIENESENTQRGAFRGCFFFALVRSPTRNRASAATG
ncbi:MAG TPA: hypothetical protein VJ696_11775, partial [Rhodanobacteraceae bacterium]|nr:hypothetical protein [Rhodanobacteraceae bacterium]